MNPWVKLSIIFTALATAGCGANEGTSDVTIRVTRDFGAEQIAQAAAKEGDGDTVVEALRRVFPTTRVGEDVTTIRNVAATGGQAWFLYINGVEESDHSDTKVHEGDQIWFDLHPQDATSDDEDGAVVGSYPEPFRNGRDGKRLPVRLDCDDDSGPACDSVKDSLQEAGVKISRGTLNSAAGVDLIRVMVGRYTRMRGDNAVRQLERGPRESGVFARFTATGDQLEALDADGDVIERLGPGTGLVAALRYADQQPTWLITGTDDVGVRAAASALSIQRLSRKFASAITPSGERPLPLTKPSP